MRNQSCKKINPFKNLSSHHFHLGIFFISSKLFKVKMPITTQAFLKKMKMRIVYEKGKYSMFICRKEFFITIFIINKHHHLITHHHITTSFHLLYFSFRSKSMGSYALLIFMISIIMMGLLRDDVRNELRFLCTGARWWFYKVVILTGTMSAGHNFWLSFIIAVRRVKDQINKWGCQYLVCCSIIWS